MIKRITCAFFALVILISAAGASEVVESFSPRASYYLSSYSAGLQAKGNGRMSVSYAVIATRTMDKIGVDEILIEYWDGSDWCDYGSMSGANHPEFYTTDDLSHGGSISFTGVVGISYRATVTVYAEKDGGSDTGSVSSAKTKCT